MSTTLLNKADSANDFAVASSQPAAVQNVVEPLIPVVDPAAIVEPIVPIAAPSVALAEPIVPYIGAPVVDPLIPYNSRVINPLFPYRIPYRGVNQNLRAVETVLPYFRSPYDPFL